MDQNIEISNSKNFYIPEGYLEAIHQFLKDEERLINFEVVEPDNFKQTVKCLFCYLVTDNFKEMIKYAKKNISDLEVLTMIHHFANNMELEGSYFSVNKKGIFFILKSTEEHIIPVFVDDMNMKFKLSIPESDKKFSFEDFI